MAIAYLLLASSSGILFAVETASPKSERLARIVLWPLDNGPEMYLDLAKPSSIELWNAVEAARVNETGWNYDEKYTRFPVTGEIGLGNGTEWQQLILSNRSVLLIEENRWKRLRFRLVENIYDCYVEAYRQSIEEKGDLLACTLKLQRLLRKLRIESTVGRK